MFSLNKTPIFNIIVRILLFILTLALVLELLCFSRLWFKIEYEAGPFFVTDSTGNNESVTNTEPTTGSEERVIKSEAIGYTGEAATSPKGTTVDERVEICHDLMLYCFGLKAELKHSDFYNNRELHHLADVRRIGISFNLVTILLLALLIAACFKRHRSKTRSALIAWLIVIAGAVPCALNYDSVYELVHELLFDNYLWILNPQTDKLLTIINPAVIADTLVLGLGIWTLLLIAHSVCSLRRNAADCTQRL